MVLSALNVLMVRHSQMVDASVLKVLSLMEQDVKLKLLIHVSVFLILIGTLPIVYVNVAIVQMEPHVFVKVSLWEIIVKDAPLNLIHYIEMVFVNVTLVMYN